MMSREEKIRALKDLKSNNVAPSQFDFSAFSNEELEWYISFYKQYLNIKTGQFDMDRVTIEDQDKLEAFNKKIRYK